MNNFWDKRLMNSIMGDEPPADGNVGAPPEDEAPPSEWSGPEYLKGIEGIESVQELLGDPSLKTVNDLPNLVKSFVNAQKMMGADKVVLPKAGTPLSEMTDIFKKLGVPDADDYKINAPEGVSFEEDFVTSFTKAAMEANLLPEQANMLLNNLDAYEKKASEDFQAKAKNQMEESVGQLKSDWGEAFTDKVNLANSAAKEFGGDEFLNYLKETGLGNNVEIIKIFSKIGESINSEDNTGMQKQTRNTLTPEEARKKYNDIMNDPTDVYHSADRPGHKDRADEVSKLFLMMG